MLDLGVYSLTVPVMYYGTDFEKVHVDAVITDTGVDATDIISMTYKDGTKVRAKCSFVDDDSNYAKVIGDKGYVVFGPINVPSYVSLYDNKGNLVKNEDIHMPNGYAYEVLEAKKMIEQGKLEADSMPWSETIRLMGYMDSIRNNIGVVFPFETKEDINLDDESVWGSKNVFGD